MEKELPATSERQKFDQAIQALLDGTDADAPALIASVNRMLRQFRLAATYDVQEVITESYTRGIRRIESGKAIDNPRGWLRNTCLNVIREFKRTEIRADNPKIDMQPWASTSMVFSELILEEDFITIRAAAQHLNPEEKQLLRQRFIEGLSWKEISQKLCDPKGRSMKEGTARQRGARALKKLRHLYECIREDIDPSQDLSG